MDPEAPVPSSGPPQQNFSVTYERESAPGAEEPPVRMNLPHQPESAPHVGNHSPTESTPLAVTLPSHYHSTPLVSAPLPQVNDSYPPEPTSSQQTGSGSPNVNPDTYMHSPDRPKSASNSEEHIPLHPDGQDHEDSINVPHIVPTVPPSEQPVRLPYPPTLPDSSSTSGQVPYPPSEPTGAPPLPYPPAPVPEPIVVDAYRPAGTTDQPPVPSGQAWVPPDEPVAPPVDQNITQGDGQVFNQTPHIGMLAKLPSYEGGGEYPSEPPPSYEESNPVPLPETIAPRQPSRAPQPSNVAPPTEIINRNFGTTPIQTRCPACGNQVRTVVVYVPGALTYLMVCIFLMLGWWFLCCLVPFCVNGFKDVHHLCPNCKRTIGTYDRIGH